MGKGPAADAVQMQTQTATNQGLNAQLALAGSSRGGNAGEALRQARMGQAQVTGQAANQAAQNTLASEQQGITNEGAVAGAMAGEEQQNNQFNAGAQNTSANNAATAGNTSALLNQTVDTQNNQYNATNTQQQQQFADNLTNQYLAQGMTLEQAQAQATQQMAEFATNSAASQTAGSASNGVANQNATTAQIGTVGGLVNSGVQTLTSDKRAKAKVEKGDPEVSAFLDHLKAKTWNYKDPDKHRTWTPTRCHGAGSAKVQARRPDGKSR